MRGSKILDGDRILTNFIELGVLCADYVLRRVEKNLGGSESWVRKGFIRIILILMCCVRSGILLCSVEEIIGQHTSY